MRDFGTSVEVNQGLREGEQVILNPSVDLAEGSKVQPKTPPGDEGVVACRALEQAEMTRFLNTLPEPGGGIPVQRWR